MATISDFCYNVLNRDYGNHTVWAEYGGAIWRMSLEINYFDRHSPRDACILHIVHISARRRCAVYCLSLVNNLLILRMLS